MTFILPILREKLLAIFLAFRQMSSLYLLNSVFIRSESLSFLAQVCKYCRFSWKFIKKVKASQKMVLKKNHFSSNHHHPSSFVPTYGLTKELNN